MENFSNEKLYERCKFYGKLALNYRNKFIGLLPEVNRRRLFEQKGFDSIFEFAFKLSGLSEKQVRIALNLEKSFSDKPILHELLTTGKVSANKLARITSIATVENQEFLGNQVQLLSKSAVETLVRDLRHENSSKFLHGQENKNQNGLFEPQIEAKSLPGQDSLNLSPEVIAKLSELQNKGLDVNAMIFQFLKEREEKIENEKAKISAQTELTENSALAIAKKPSRYIPAKTKKLLYAIHGTKCAITHCQKSAQTIHHTARFALSQAHNPRYLAPLCNEHHQIAHTIDINFHQRKVMST